MNIISLISIARELDIDKDLIISETNSSTQLLLRLGDQQQYPFETHSGANETILVLDGRCYLEVEEQTYILKNSDQLTIAAGTEHRFLPDSECCLNIRFEKA
jgi:quercetin dioxygenase-like cupin family protein